MLEQHFNEIWLVDFEFVAPDGERQRPVCMVAEEFLSGRQIRMWEEELRALPAAPFNTGPDCLLVAYFASAELACFRALGWPLPYNILDLFAEHRVITNGLRNLHGNSLIGAAQRLGIDTIEATEKETMRELVMGGGPWNESERQSILDYCASDVELLRPLLNAMAPQVTATNQRLGHAIWRGRYMGAVATMEHNGIPIDTETLGIVQSKWSDIQDAMIADVDSGYGVYDGRTFKADRFAEYLAQAGIPWPRLDTGGLALDDDTFRSMAKAYPQVSPLRELRHSLGELRLNSLAVGIDGRNRTLLSPFRSKTGRNQPSNSKAIFGAATWVRGSSSRRPAQRSRISISPRKNFSLRLRCPATRRCSPPITRATPIFSLPRTLGSPPRMPRRRHMRLCATSARRLSWECNMACQHSGWPSVRDCFWLRPASFCNSTGRPIAPSGRGPS
jgi:DNA polymerase I